MCDFWARVRLRKADPDELLEEMRDGIAVSREEEQDLETAIQSFWRLFGLRNLRSLCIEEPNLCEKIRMLEEQVRSLVS